MSKDRGVTCTKPVCVTQVISHHKQQQQSQHLVLYAPLAWEFFVSKRRAVRAVLSGKHN